MLLSKRLMAPAVAGGGYDTDAQAYIDDVELADGAALETGVTDAINDFVVGCKADGIWTAIKASCIMAGARTLDGALTPLVGPAPTNNNFVSGDYNRKTGLLGNGTNKYLNTNRANNADGQNDQHNAVWLSSVTSTIAAHVGAGGTGSGANNLGYANQNFTRNRSSSVEIGSDTPADTFYGMSRSVSGSYTVRRKDSGSMGSNTITQVSATPSSDDIFVFARNNGSGSSQIESNARIAIYTIGGAISLVDLESRMSALITAIDGAIA